MKLDLGAGVKREEGYLAADIAGSPHIRCDARALPFADGAFEEVRCWHLLEHLERRDLIPVMNECHRILRPGGMMDIEMPVFPFWTAMADPTHVSFYVPQTWDYFTDREKYGDHMALYGIRPWRLAMRRRLVDGQIMRVALQKPEGDS